MTAKNTAALMSMMSATGRKTRRWEKAEIITPAQRDAIIAFERQRGGKRFMRGLIGLAVFAIGLGILSIIAANWMHISGSVKIGAHFLVNAIVAAVMWKAAADNNKWWREGAAFIFFALNLTLIVLVGQVFHLPPNWAGGLGLWMLISSPALFIYGHTVMNAVPWMIAFVATSFIVLADIMEPLSDLQSFLLGLGVTIFFPLGLLAAGLSERVAVLRPHWAITSFRMGLLMLLVAATGASVYWYIDLSDELWKVLGASGYVYMLLIFAAAIGSVYGFDYLRRKRSGVVHDQTGTLFVIGSLVSAMLPLVLMVGDGISFLSAVHFVAYWAFVGFMGYRMSSDQMVSSAITLITLRIIIVYIELFGGLLMTGFGLIGGGVLLLLTIKAARHVQHMIKQVTYEGGEDVV